MMAQEGLVRAMVNTGLKAGTWLWVMTTAVIALVSFFYGASAFDFQSAQAWIVLAVGLLTWVPFALMLLSPRHIVSRGLFRIFLALVAGVAFGFIGSGTVKWYHGLDLVLGFLCWAICFLWWHDEMATGADISNESRSASAEVGPVESQPEALPSFPWSEPSKKLASLAGMSQVKAELSEVLVNFAAYSRGGPVSDRNGILLSGPPGNGKSAFASAIAAELGLPLLKVGVQDLTSKWVNESATVVRSLFAEARSRPCVLFIDEFDAVAPNRSGGAGIHNEDKKVVNALLAEIDTTRSARVILVAATNFPDELDPAIARDGRFDFRIELPYPDLEAREGILAGLLSQHKLVADKAVVRKVAEIWERRSAAFIESTVKRLRDSGKGRQSPVTADEFKAAARAASRRPSALPPKGPKVSELYLSESVRVEANSLVHRLRHWEDIAERGGEPPSGVLLFGPPGTGKTALVRCLARELGDWHIFEVSTPDVLQNPKEFKKTVELAAQHRPAFVFLDEADELLRTRMGSAASVATNEILKCMDGAMGKIPEIVFVAATNNPEAIDSAAVRGGRFAEKIYMGRFAGQELAEFLRDQLSAKTGLKVSPKVSAEDVAELLGEAAPADAIALIRKAVNYTFTEKGQRPLELEDIQRAKTALAI